ncbi:MAG: hypothetical protein IJL30_09740 [Clostridia bacterium]|nr:hypothetical protein [Clostridia bacterium]
MQTADTTYQGSEIELPEVDIFDWLSWFSDYASSDDSGVNGNEQSSSAQNGTDTQNTPPDGSSENHFDESSGNQNGSDTETPEENAAPQTPEQSIDSDPTSSPAPDQDGICFDENGDIILPEVP